MFNNYVFLKLFLVERLHSKVSAHGHIVFANSLWSYFMLNKQFDNADNILKELKNSKFIQYRQLLSDIRTNNNIELGNKLLEIIPHLKEISQSTNIGLVYSALIDAYGL